MEEDFEVNQENLKK